jgi:hypothetical protein
MTGLGHEERFLPSRLSAGFLLRKETIAEGAAMGETRRFPPFAGLQWNRQS